MNFRFFSKFSKSTRGALKNKSKLLLSKPFIGPIEPIKTVEKSIETVQLPDVKMNS